MLQVTIKSAEAGLRLEDSASTTTFWQMQARDAATTGAGFANLLVSSGDGNQAIITGSTGTAEKPGGALKVKSVRDVRFILSEQASHGHGNQLYAQ